jgi:predicted phosphodiesterase
MFKISRTLPLAKEIQVIGIGDIHNGSPNCRFDKFLKAVEYVEKTPNCYVIGMGDYIDAIVPSDKRYSSLEPFRAVDTTKKEVLEALRPIQDKILCMLTGNHESKIAKQGYGDPTAYLCQELKVPYGGTSCYIRLKVHPRLHRNPLTIYCHHGYSAGRKTGGCVNNIEGLAQYWDADVYMVGHSHKLWNTVQVKVCWAGYKKVAFCNTGTFMETATYGHTGYSEEAGYPPLKMGCIKIKWLPEDEDIQASEVI